MTDAQRDLLAKGLADIAKGVFIATPIAVLAEKISGWEGLALMALSIALFNIGYHIAGGGHDRL
jgi:hypothetical protein